jgi:hypothetical protein
MADLFSSDHPSWLCVNKMQIENSAGASELSKHNALASTPVFLVCNGEKTYYESKGAAAKAIGASRGNIAQAIHKGIKCRGYEVYEA